MPATATSPETFLDLAKRSGAVDQRRLDGFLARYGGSLPEAGALAEALIAAGHMTRYQAEPLLLGKPQRFMLSGKYRVLDRLGAGGMASVFLCEHKIMRRRVAIKMLPPKLANNPSMLDRFHREARAIASVHHPNIVGAHDVDADGNVHFLVMEYVEGTNFHELVRRSGPLPVARAAHYVAQAAVGLAHAHEKGLVHRDIKPANLLIDRIGVVKILDLGLALVFSSDDDNLTKDHDANSILGTAEYLAPEQAIDSHGVDHRADLYSLGMTMYFLLTAQTPYGEGTTAQKLIWHQLRTPRNIRDIRSDVPEELWAVLQKMLAKKPEDRYQSGREVVEALAPWTQTPIPMPTEAEMPKPLVPLDGDAQPSSYGPPSDASGLAPMTLPAFALPTPPERTSSGLNGGKLPSYSGMPAVDISAPPVDISAPAVDISAPAPAVNISAPSSDATPPPSKPVPTPRPVSAARPVPTPRPPSASNPPSARTVPTTPSASAVPVGASAASGVTAPASNPAKGPKSSPSRDRDEDDDSGAKSSTKTLAGPVTTKVKRGKKKEEAKGPPVAVIAGVGGGLLALLVVAWLAGLFGGKEVAKQDIKIPPVPPKVDNGPDMPPENPGAPKDGKGTTSTKTKTPSVPKPDKPSLPTPPEPKKVPPEPRLPERVQSITKGATATTNSVDDAKMALDKNTASVWTVKGRTGWLQVELAADVALLPVSHYRVGVGEGNQDADPKEWKLKGSADGKEWVDLDGRSNERFEERQLLKGYDVANPKPFRFYRLDVTNNVQGDLLAVSEWDLFADPNPPKPMTSEPAAPTLTAAFYPTDAREVFFDLAANAAVSKLATGKPSWAMARNKWAFTAPKPPEPPKAGAKPPEPTKYKVLSDLTVTTVQQTLPTALQPNPAWPSNPAQFRAVNVPQGAAQIREEDGVISFVALSPNGTEVNSDPLIRLGAKQGESWNKKLPNGSNQVFKLEELTPTKAVIRTQGQPFPLNAPKGATAVQVITTTYEAGVGEVERKIDLEVTQQNKPPQTVPYQQWKKQ